MSFSIFGYDFTLSELITLSMSVFLTCFYAIKTGGLKKLIKEVVAMNYKFKTVETVEETKGQTFSSTKPVYRLNKANGELELTDDTIDLQALINSCIDTALDRTLDRLLPKVEQAEDIMELDLMREDLDMAMQVSNVAEEYRSKLGLSDSLSMNDIFNEVSKQAEILKAKIDTAQNIKKELKSDEKKETIKESE